ncbi:MAG TPA: cytochrome c3 family protein [Candidatus Binatia bacterium]|nr:cytochrome c3 family protein [Candidatus Binatia bacterium]
MPQVFHPSTNTFSKLSIFGALFVLGGALWGLALINRSGYVTRAGVAREQPIPFSHRHHAGELGIDCRYCHTSVETAAIAGIPPTKTCMNCHSQIWVDSPMLEPVRASFRNDQSIHWIKVNDLPDFVYFNHSIHVHQGIGCVSCHGRVDQMNLTWQETSLQMEWCLNCHRHPEQFVRPRDQVFNLAWQPPNGDQLTQGTELVKQYHIKVGQLTNCSVCHR